jgi:homoserine kinase
MGCGSSAAALLAGVLLASHFGELGWDLHTCMEEACRREGHPDNVAACALGYMTVSANDGGRVVAVTCGEEVDWKLVLALPAASLATERARALLPTAYSRADAVHNIQRSALLVGAFARGRGDLLRVAMEDRIHQPYRSQVCPLVPVLLPLAGSHGVLGVALSGAGPGVLLVLDAGASVEQVTNRIHEVASDPKLEVLETRVAGGVEIKLL